MYFESRGHAGGQKRLFGPQATGLLGAAVILLTLCFCGCATEITPKPSSYPSQAERDAQYARLHEDYLRRAATDAPFKAASDAYAQCVFGYVRGHRKAPLTGTELTDAALSACHAYLDEMKHQTVEGLYGLEPLEKRQQDAESMAAKVNESIRGAVLRIIAEVPVK